MNTEQDQPMIIEPSGKNETYTDEDGIWLNEQCIYLKEKINKLVKENDELVKENEKLKKYHSLLESSLTTSNKRQRYQ